jgi:hypothetical protein
MSAIDFGNFADTGECSGRPRMNALVVQLPLQVCRFHGVQVHAIFADAIACKRSHVADPQAGVTKEEDDGPSPITLVRSLAKLIARQEDLNDLFLRIRCFRFRLNAGGLTSLAGLVEIHLRLTQNQRSSAGLRVPWSMSLPREVASFEKGLQRRRACNCIDASEKLWTARLFTLSPIRSTWS